MKFTIIFFFFSFLCFAQNNKEKKILESDFSIGILSNYYEPSNLKVGLSLSYHAKINKIPRLYVGFDYSTMRLGKQYREGDWSIYMNERGLHLSPKFYLVNLNKKNIRIYINNLFGVRGYITRSGANTRCLEYDWNLIQGDHCVEKEDIPNQVRSDYTLSYGFGLGTRLKLNNWLSLVFEISQLYGSKDKMFDVKSYNIDDNTADSFFKINPTQFWVKIVFNGTN